MSQNQTNLPPSAEATEELLTEGQRLKQRLREQYADQIEAALRNQSYGILPQGIQGVESYYYTNRTLGGSQASPLSKRETLGEPTSTAHSTSGGTSAVSFGSSSSPTYNRSEAIRSTSRAVQQAEDRERQLKALINAHDPIRTSLRQAQERAIGSLIAATETSLAWEMRLAAEEKDPSSPIHEKTKNGSVGVKNEEGNRGTTETSGSDIIADERGPQTVGAQQTTSETDENNNANGKRASETVLTSPFRQSGYANEKDALERRLGLLLKLQTEHKTLVQCESATRNLYDERNRFVEEAVDVVLLREMQAQQEAARGGEAQPQYGDVNVTNPNVSAIETEYTAL